MDARSELRDFLSTRRARITPEQAGLTAFGGNRRVPGLRREELATLAGVSISYYIRLERGDAGGVSDSVLNAISTALRLDAAERAHFGHLVRSSAPSPLRSPTPERALQVRPGIVRVLDALATVPAVVYDPRLDVLAGNRLGRALYEDVFAETGAVPNLARFLFLRDVEPVDAQVRAAAADDVVALLRTALGADSGDRRLGELVSELSAHSADFRRRWAEHNVRVHSVGAMSFAHRHIGPITLSYETFPFDDGLSLKIYTAEPGTEAVTQLARLTDWAAGAGL